MIYGEPTILTSQGVVYDPEMGPQLEQSWRGRVENIRLLEVAFVASGYSTRRTESGGAATLVVTMPQTDIDGATTEPTDKYTISTDLEQTPLWNSAHLIEKLDELIAEASAPAGTTQEEMLATIREPLENAMKGRRTTGAQDPITQAYLYTQLREGPLLPSECKFNEMFVSSVWATKTVQFMDKLYSVLLRGMTSVSLEWPVLRWQRSYHVRYLTRRKVYLKPPVYTRAALIRDFLLPPGIAFQLPDNPDSKPSHTEYAWRERSRNIDTDFFGRVSDAAEFVFAAWPDFLYEFVT